MIVNKNDNAPRIAALMTCFNRRELTLRCLRSLSAINENVEIFLVNDGCTDGTPEAIQAQYPQVHLIQGSGSLYWNRGMHLAWSTALAGDYDFYLWVNDDVRLYPDFLTDLLADSREKGDAAVISGAMKDPATGKVAYGGASRITRRLTPPDGTLQPIQNLNGNVLLVPRSVVKKIGIIDPLYEHHFGDGDYGLRALENGVEVLLAKRYAGECAANNVDRLRKPGVSIGARFRYLYSPFGSPPKSSWHFFCQHKNCFYAAIHVLYLHWINLLPDGLCSVLCPNHAVSKTAKEKK